MAAGSRKKWVDGEPITLTKVNGIFPYTQAALEIGEAQAWREDATEALVSKMLEAITAQPPELLTRSRLTGLRSRQPSEVALHLVHPDDVNEWLENEGLDYRWTAPRTGLPAPERRLARLRALGGNSKYRNGEWHFTGIIKLVQHEKQEGKSRSDEKTIRADLKLASQSERDAKSAGFASGIGKR